MPPRVFKGADPINKLHQWLYPANSKYYWYRQGKVSHTPLSTKYVKFTLLSLLVAFAGSGAMMFSAALALAVVMHEWDAYQYMHETNLLSLLKTDPSGILGSNTMQNVSNIAKDMLHHNTSAHFIQTAIKDPAFIGFWMLMAGLSTLMVYYWGASTLNNMYYIEKKSQAKDWKCQPDNWLTKELELEEKLSGCMNAFLAGAFGTGLFFFHQSYPFLKMYYTTGPRGFVHYVASCVLVFLWVDFLSYWVHRALHHKWIYKYIHKWHHRYKCPTAFSAFAMSPVEFLSFQSTGILCMCIFPVHVMSFLSVMTLVAYHNQIDHSGVYFEGDLPWMPSTKYHDDHHQYFHVNYGVQLILWDWMFGSLRQSDRVYAEDIFQGEHDAKKQN